MILYHISIYMYALSAEVVVFVVRLNVFGTLANGIS